MPLSWEGKKSVLVSFSTPARLSATFRAVAASIWAFFEPAGVM